MKEGIGNTLDQAAVFLSELDPYWTVVLAVLAIVSWVGIAVYDSRTVKQGDVALKLRHRKSMLMTLYLAVGLVGLLLVLEGVLIVGDLILGKPLSSTNPVTIEASAFALFMAIVYVVSMKSYSSGKPKDVEAMDTVVNEAEELFGIQDK